MLSSTVTWESAKSAELKITSREGFCLLCAHETPRLLAISAISTLSGTSKSEKGDAVCRTHHGFYFVMKENQASPPPRPTPVLWPLSFQCHTYINSFVILAIFFSKAWVKFSNLIIPRLPSYTDLIKEIKMCFLFVTILNHHLLKNVDIISHWKVWETDHVYKEVLFFLKSMWIKFWNPHEEKKSARIFSWKRFYFTARAGNVKWSLQI